MRNLYLIVLLLFVFSVSAFAQGRSRPKKKDRRRFKASVLMGAYATQIDGDLFVGFNKFGFSAGVRGTVVLDKHFDVDIELLYQEKGSRFEANIMGRKDRIIHLDYMEVPFLLRYYPGVKDRGVNMAVGIAFGRIINSQIEERVTTNLVSYEAIADDFTSNELSLILELNLRLDQPFHIGGRYSFAFTRFYDNPEGAGPGTIVGGSAERITLLRNYLIGGYVGYTF